MVMIVKGLQNGKDYLQMASVSQSFDATYDGEKPLNACGYSCVQYIRNWQVTLGTGSTDRMRPKMEHMFLTHR